MSYATSYDLAVDPASLLDHKLVVSVGHDEYWTHEMRANLQGALSGGVSVAFLGGNDMYWQARYEDGGRTLVEYRTAALDPQSDPSLKTTLFRELVPPLFHKGHRRGWGQDLIPPSTMCRSSAQSASGRCCYRNIPQPTHRWPTPPLLH